MRARTVRVTPIQQNCTLLVEEGHAVVVDPGGDVEAIVSALDGAVVDAILLTHGHFDHAGGVEALRAVLDGRQGDPVAVIGPHRDDAFLLASIPLQAATFGFAGMDAARPDRWLDDGARLDLLGREWEVAHVPGHSPGHVVFISREDSLVIAGDTLFRGTVGRTDFPYGDAGALLSGIGKKLMVLPDSFTVLPGHGLPTTIGDERRNNPYLSLADQRR